MAASRRSLGMVFNERIKTERNIPHLPGKNKNDGAEFHAELAVRKQRHHRQHHPRQKTQHRNRLQNVQQRNQHDFRAFGLRRGVTVGQRKHQADAVRHQYAHERIQRVGPQAPRILRNFGFHSHRTEPRPANRIHAENHPDHRGKYRNVDQKRVPPARPKRPVRCRRYRTLLLGQREGRGHGEFKLPLALISRWPHQNQKSPRSGPTGSRFPFGAALRLR